MPMGVAKIQDSNSSGTHLIITYNHTLHVLNMKYGRWRGGGSGGNTVTSYYTERILVSLSCLFVGGNNEGPIATLANFQIV